MESLQKNKGIIATILVLIFAMVVYNLFFKSDIPVAVEGDQNVGADLVEMYHNLQAVSLNPELFNSNSYLNLTDFSTSVPAQPVGRTNPFDVIGR
jgi:hypothetical protein